MLVAALRDAASRLPPRRAAGYEVGSAPTPINPTQAADRRRARLPRRLRHRRRQPAAARPPGDRHPRRGPQRARLRRLRRATARSRSPTSRRRAGSSRRKNGPYGLVDMRKEVERRTGGALRAEHVVIQSNHSHSGPDALGVWGGVPDEYRKLRRRPDRRRDRRGVRAMRAGQALLRDRARARPALEPVRLRRGQQGRRLRRARAAGARRRRQAARDAAELLRAHDRARARGNTKVSGDWVQAANPLLEQRFGGEAVTVVGTLGRTQPADRGCSDPARRPGTRRTSARSTHYAARVVDRRGRGAANAQPLGGDPVVAARSYLVQDVATNAPARASCTRAAPLGAPLNRSLTPPWLTGQRARHGDGDRAHRRRAAVGRSRARCTRRSPLKVRGAR